MHYPTKTPFSPPFNHYVPELVQSPNSFSSWGTPSTQPPPPQSPAFYPTSPYSVSGGSVSGSTRPPPSLHPLLQNPGPLAYDIRNQPNSIPDLAFKPNLTHITISVLGHPGWTFGVQSPNGITIYDILNAIYFHFQFPVKHNGQFTLPLDVTGMAEDHYRQRTRGSRSAFDAGMKRLDCVCLNFRFAGLTPSGTPGVWILHLA